MIGLRSLVSGTIGARTVLARMRQPIMRPQKMQHHDDPPMPLENLPFSVPNRYVATLKFTIFFGLGLWAPYIILWYSMAKNAL